MFFFDPGIDPHQSASISLNLNHFRDCFTKKKRVWEVYVERKLHKSEEKNEENGLDFDENRSQCSESQISSSPTQNTDQVILPCSATHQFLFH